MIISAADLTRTRLCRAAGCPEEALNYARFCPRHDKQHRQGHTVPLHVTPPPGEPCLWCTTCRQDKPDTEFGLRPGGDAGRPTNRRGRFWACLQCEATRKRTRRARLTALELEAARARDRARNRPT